MENAKFWREFFQLYKDLPALWRVGSTEYTDRALKSNCYLKLIRKLKEIHPDADREMVVKKINNFRTTYRKEFRRLRECKRVGKSYKPTLWYFDCLSFLDDQEDVSGPDQNREEKKEISQEEVAATNAINFKRSASKRYGDFKDNDDEEKQISTHISKKRKIKRVYSRKKPSSRSKLSHEEEQQAKVDADILAKSWALQYKEMHGNQKLIARKLISDILFYGGLGTVNMSQVIDLQEILLKGTTIEATEPQSPQNSNSSAHFVQHEYINCDSLRESPLELKSCSSSPLSPPTNSVSEFQINEVKFEDS